MASRAAHQPPRDVSLGGISVNTAHREDSFKRGPPAKRLALYFAINIWSGNRL